MMDDGKFIFKREVKEQGEDHPTLQPLSAFVRGHNAILLPTGHKMVVSVSIERLPSVKQ